MIDITIQNLIKSFEVGDNLLDGLTFQIDSGERVGILGKNGCGKTTLFKILTGEYDYDEGQLSIAPGKKLGLISQIPVYPEGYTVEDVLDTAFTRLHKMERELEDLTARMGTGETDKATLTRYDDLSQRFETEGGYDTTVRLGKVCNGLEIPPFWRTRTSCCWMSPPTIWTSAPQSGWRSIWIPFRAPSLPSPTTVTFWTVW